jgi:hypothetical protein
MTDSEDRTQGNFLPGQKPTCMRSRRSARKLTLISVNAPIAEGGAPRASPNLVLNVTQTLKKPSLRLEGIGKNAKGQR